MIKYSLSDVLFTKVQQRVLAIFFGQPDRSFHTNEIIRLTHSGTGAVQRELIKLETVGLVTVKLVGNQKQYQANRNTPIFSELRNIVLKTFGLTHVIRELLITSNLKIEVAFVYGSIAKNEDTTESDIDIMLIGHDLSYADLYPLLEKAETQLGRRVNPTCYTPSEWMRKQKENNHFLNQVINQPKIFLVGSENELKQFR